VKRYLHEKIAYVQEHGAGDEHVLIVPGAENRLTRDGCSRVYTIAAPIVSRRTQYRVLLNLRAVGEIIERERPDIIESSDPYQLGWKLAAISREQRIATVAFYHSHFSEAYLRRSRSGSAARRRT
jgi:alpha-1,6-mannosyltransferase